MKKLLILIISAFIFLSTSCTNNIINTTSINNNSSISTTTQKEEDNMKELVLKINDTIVNVSWENNPSVDALKELAKDTLTINMHEYGGFEQTGLIGKSLPSNDSSINVVPGDIVLYNSNQISIFYNNSRWSYTMLGHINLTNSELSNLLNVDAVTVTLTLK